MFIIRLFATALFVLAATAASVELVQLIRSHTWQPLVAGQFWHNLHAESLDSIRVFIQRQIHPALWDLGISPILRLPAWLAAGVPGVLLLLLDIRMNADQPRKPRRRTRFRTAG